MESQDTLSVVLSEFTRTLVTDFPIGGILEHLVRRVVDILPIDSAGVSLIAPTSSPLLMAGSDEAAVRYEHLQTELGEGPCLAAYHSNEAVTIPDLTQDDRFPAFAARAREEGLVAVFTFPLRSDDRCLGALDLYRTTPGGLDERDMATAQTLADAATAYLLNAEARTARIDFVAKVSHELRTPMTSITGFVELLQDGQGGGLSHPQEQFVGAIARNSEKLTALANDLLTVTSLDSTANHRPFTDVDLGAVVLAAQCTLERAVSARRLEVSFEVADSPVVVRGDASGLESLVTNLVGNALKFTADGGWVRCRVYVADGSARLAVSDNGMGVPESEQRDLFKRFVRSTSAQEHAIEGSGLGLTIVDSIVRNHGGDVRLDSTHLMGSTFTVRLPLVHG